MTYLDPQPSLALALPRITVRGLQNLVLWMALATGFFVKSEPAPTDIFFLLTIILAIFVKSRLSFTITPLILFLLLYNLGGFISFLEVSSEFKATMFVITSIYMAVMAIVFAILLTTDPEGYFPIMRNGWIVAGTIAGVTGLLGYFNIAGTGAYFELYGRAVGAFKDPNVFSTFLVAPAIFLIHGFLTGTQRWPMISAGSLLIILAALFLAFSRGAWMNVMLAAVLVTIFTFALSRDGGMRLRIVVLVVLGTLLFIAGMAALLSIDQVRQLFIDRFTLVKDYDAGETGRFGAQVRSIPILLERPLGFGPTFFRRIFVSDPHNVYLNAFAAYGWLGGVTYPVLILSSIMVGWKAMMTPTPVQPFITAVWCSMVAVMLQGVQIDTDHWRHFYLLLGMNWGLFAAAMTYKHGGYRAAG